MPSAASPSCTSDGISAARWKTTSTSGMLRMRARYWRGLLRLTFMPHSARKESVAASKVPFPGKAKRISPPALIDIAPFPGSREAYQMFFPALQVAHRHRVLPLLIAANDERQAHLFFSSQSQACANAVSRHIHLGA